MSRYCDDPARHGCGREQHPAARAAAEARGVRALAWQEGYNAARHMARMWGHVDIWEDEPENPYVDPADGVEA